MVYCSLNLPRQLENSLKSNLTYRDKDKFINNKEAVKQHYCMWINIAGIIFAVYFFV